MTFVAEWGDFILAGLVGHVLCTGLGGRMVAKKIFVRTVTPVGVLFLAFAISS